jgi:hypothetical protein
MRQKTDAEYVQDLAEFIGYTPRHSWDHVEAP